MYRKKPKAILSYLLVVVLFMSLPGSTAFAVGDRLEVEPASIESAPSALAAPTPSSPLIHTIEFDFGEDSIEATLLVEDGDALGELPAPEYPGYVFLGWFSDLVDGVEVTGATIPDEDMILHAQWGTRDAVSFDLQESSSVSTRTAEQDSSPPVDALSSPVMRTVTFNSHGGSVVAAITVEQGQPIGALPNSTRVDHSLAGWYTAPAGSIGSRVLPTTVITDDITLHARWQFVPTRVIGVTLPAIGTMDRGQQRTLQPTFQPSNFTRNRTAVTWHSSNTRVAVVNNNGLLRPVGRGTATISVTARTDGGAAVTARQTVTVRQRATGITTVHSLRMVRGGSAWLPAIVQPLNANNRAVTYSSSNPRVVSISARGEMRARAAGTARVTVRSADGGHVAHATVRVVPQAVRLRDFRIHNPSDRILNVGGRTRLWVDPVPATATNFMPRFSSNNNAVATVDRTGTITAVGNGTARITVEQGSITRSIIVRVGTVRTVCVTLNFRQATVIEGTTFQVRTNLRPANISPNTIRWSSNNTGVATVNANGLVRGVREGRATITATTWDNRRAHIVIMVRARAFSYVQNVGLRFTSPPQRRRSTEGIVLHHTVGNINVHQTHRIHIDRGMWGIAYHFLIDRQGRVWQGRPLDTGGGHVRGALNERTIGIAWVGNFENEHLTPAARTSGERLIGDILRAYPSIRWIHGHRDLRTHVDRNQTATACPGRNFPTQHFRRLLR
ncbi:MAG: Ig-like domain-containing protein [Coriobacteriia bacterium]|nr:Ig-like domain-containing protein [Coriobacteriia bacterium]